MNSTQWWFKSSYSDSGGADCVEVAYTWRKSSYSSSTGGECLEVAYTAAPGAVTDIRVRDSKNPTGPNLTVSAGAWTAFLATGATPHPKKA